MSEVQEGLKYAKSHEWIRSEGDGVVTIGITDHAQELLGDMVFIELPEVDTEFDTEEECAVVESVKAASDVYTPIAGTITEVMMRWLMHLSWPIRILMVMAGCLR